MAGIVRIIITDEVRGPGAYRFKEAKKQQPYADMLYRRMFELLECPIANGYDEIHCAKDDLMAAYDRLLGIDVIFTFENGMKSTLQEKFLTKSYQTVTVEYYNDPIAKIEGDWFHMKAQYYFVGYARKGTGDKSGKIRDCILLDWAATARETAKETIIWGVRPNKRDRAKANFKYVEVSEIPENCIMAKYWDEEFFLGPGEPMPLPPASIPEPVQLKLELEFHKEERERNQSGL